MDGDADRFVEARYRSLQESSLDRNRVGYADPWWRGVAAAGREGYRGKSNAGDQDKDEICAFCEQAGDRAGISGFGT
jgi:hypothetical protein